MAHYESFPQRITPDQLDRYWQLVDFAKAHSWAKRWFLAETEKELNAKVAAKKASKNKRGRR